MGIFTLVAIFTPLVVAASIYEGILWLIDRIRENREWKAIRRAYYPKYHY